MSKRYGHTGVGGGHQDQGERKDDGWESRQGGEQSTRPGRQGGGTGGSGEGRPSPAQGTNTQGSLPGIGEASERAAAVIDRSGDGPVPEADEDPVADAEARRRDAATASSSDAPGSGTDQPPRMGGPLGPDPDRPHLPEGAQDGESRGTGAGGFDEGVDASTIGAVHQGARPDPR
jgi:hypothetical protein